MPELKKLLNNKLKHFIILFILLRLGHTHPLVMYWLVILLLIINEGHPPASSVKKEPGTGSKSKKKQPLTQKLS